MANDKGARPQHVNSAALSVGPIRRRRIEPRERELRRHAATRDRIRELRRLPAHAFQARSPDGQDCDGASVG
jgi:hypothetical protein